jgi:hypothetical protein
MGTGLHACEPVHPLDVEGERGVLTPAFIGNLEGAHRVERFRRDLWLEMGETA